MEDYLNDYKESLKDLTEEQTNERNLYLKGLQTGLYYGPTTGLSSIDKPWLKYFKNENILKTMPRITIYNYLYESNKNNQLSIALEYFGRKITYFELFRKIEKTAKNFSALGVKKGDIVTICMPSTPETIYSIYALNKIGAIPNLIDPRYSEDMIKDLIVEANSKCLLTIDLCNEKIKKIESETNLEKIISVSATNSVPIIRHIKKNNVVENEKWMNWTTFTKKESTYEENEYVQGKFSVLVHTGGTTGKPKGIMLTDDNINSIVFQYKNGDIALSKKQTFLDIIPPFAAYGICSSIHMPLSLGMKTILIPKFNPNEFDKLILKHKPTHVLGVPSFWENLSKNPAMANVDLSFLRSPGSGGDGILASSEEKVNEFFKSHNSSSKLIKGYGMSEVSSSACTCTTSANELTSVGIPLIKTTIGIFEPNTTNELSYNSSGEICITGPSVMNGYFNNESLTNKTIKTHSDGLKWVHTGDLGYITENGILYVTGRIKRMIVRYDGFKMYPTAIEEVISRTPGIESVAVVKSYNELGNIVKAFMVANKNVKDLDLLESEVLENCILHLAERSIPEKFEFIDELPLTNLGKINYDELENREFSNKKVLKNS